MRVRGLQSDIAAKYATPGARARRGAIVASLNNIAPGLHEVGPVANFSVLSGFEAWVCTATTLLGRLELPYVLVILTPAF